TTAIAMDMRRDAKSIFIRDLSMDLTQSMPPRARARGGHAGAVSVGRIGTSWRDGYLEHTVALMCEELIGRFDLIKFEAMCHKRARVHLTGRYDVHEAAHPLPAAGAECRDDRVVSEAGRKSPEWDAEVIRVNAERRQRSAGPQHSKRPFECLLAPERFDGDIDAAAVGQAHDL